MPVFEGSYPARQNEGSSGQGRRPVVFDVLGPDLVTSLLPTGIKLVLHTGPGQMNIKYSRKVEAAQTEDGFVEFHWGDEPTGIDFSGVTGGFKRLYTGLSAVTNPAVTGGSRRETLAYDSYLDWLALFHHNGSLYDAAGKIYATGAVKITFDGGTYLGWFDTFSVTETESQPFMFQLSASFLVKTERTDWRSV